MPTTYDLQGHPQSQPPMDDDAMGWDDAISGDDANGYEPLPEGDYYFTVNKFTRGRYEGGPKMPPCNKAVLTLGLVSAWQPTPDKPSAKGTTTVNLFLVRSQRRKLSQFFIAIGALKPGEEKAMDWNIVPGSSGTCAVTLREWMGNDGKKHTGNDVSRFYDPEKSPVPPMPPVPPAGPQYAPAAVVQSTSYQPGDQQATMPMPPAPASTPWSSGKF